MPPAAPAPASDGPWAIVEASPKGTAILLLYPAVGGQHPA